VNVCRLPDVPPANTASPVPLGRDITVDVPDIGVNVKSCPVNEADLKHGLVAVVKFDMFVPFVDMFDAFVDMFDAFVVMFHELVDMFDAFVEMLDVFVPIAFICESVILV